LFGKALELPLLQDFFEDDANLFIDRHPITDVSAFNSVFKLL
jgi:hypothetical protein